MVSETYAIRRSDGLGNQIGNRLFANEYYSRDCVPETHVHSELKKIAHLSYHNDWKEYFDYIYYTFTGLSNEDVASEIADVKYIHKIVGGNLRPGHDRPEITLFAREYFDKHREHFLNYNNKYNIYDDKPGEFNVVMHIRRGDEWVNAQKQERQGRIIDLDYFETICGIVHDVCKQQQIKPIFFIETDSPEAVQSFADKINAHVNVTSDHSVNITKNPELDVPCEKDLPYWKKLVGTIQGAYNLATADLFIASSSAFSNLPFMLSDIPTITPIGRFCRFVLDEFRDDSKILKYIQSGPDGWNVLPDDKKKRVRVGWNHIIYNYNFNAARDILGSLEIPDSVQQTTAQAILKKRQQ